MFHLNDKFTKPLSPCKWRNLVSAFLNNLIGDQFIKVLKPSAPSATNPPTIGLNIQQLSDTLTNMEAFAYPLKVKSYVTSDQIRLKIRLDTPYVRLANVIWTIASGYSADSSDAGWYIITHSAFVPAGNKQLWLVENTASGAAANTLVFASAALTDTTKKSFLIATIATDGTVTQYQVGAITEFTAFKGKGSSATEVSKTAAPSTSTIWERDGTSQATAKKNLTLHALVSSVEGSDAYDQKLYFAKLEFDLDGRLMKVTGESTAVELVQYQYLRDLE